MSSVWKIATGERVECHRAAMKRVSACLLTGALGAGKTTLLREVIAGALAGRRVVVIMNEIGELSVDARVVTGLDYVENLVELNDGCLCCSVDDQSFDFAIAELLGSVDPELIIIESSGVAYPGPVIERIARCGLGLDSVVTVVDGAAFTGNLRRYSSARAQIRAADFLVMNKADLCTRRQSAGLRRRLRRMNRRALLLECVRGRADARLLFGTAGPSRGGPVTAGQHGGGHELPLESFAYRSSSEVDRASFERFLEHLPPTVYRAKGFLRMGGNEWSYLFNFTCGRYQLDAIKLRSAELVTQAVFIGRELSSSKERIIADFRACELQGV